MFGIFLFCLDLELPKKCEKPGLCKCAETRSFLVFSNNSRSNQNKKISNKSRNIRQISQKPLETAILRWVNAEALNFQESFNFTAAFRNMYF